MSADAKEAAFQQDIIDQMVAGGWQVGDPKRYDRERALYPADCLAYVQNTQPQSWAKYTKLYPSDPATAFLDRLTAQLAKVDPQASDRDLRTFGTLGVLRHEVRDNGVIFKLCQFKPDHDLNPRTLALYAGNILRVVPELVYSPHATAQSLATTGAAAKQWRIDLVLFVNGIPVATLELKSEFKQAVQNAIKQYKSTRLPKDPATNQPEPLLTFKRGALVHFAVSQAEVYMTTRLAGDATRFLPFNRGTADGGAGNDTPADLHRYATAYLWTEVLAPANLLQIIGRFIHLEIKIEEDWEGRKQRCESLIFPRYHQWDLVKRLIDSSRAEGPGHKYLVQHSAGSGKSNSIAWTAHQLSTLYDPVPDRRGEKLFDSVIVVTDRTVLDSQLQETISQFEHADGVVGRINREEGQGAKSEKLAQALAQSQPIIIVTIQTFPYVLRAIEDSASLKQRRYAIIADEAHSSQTGRTAGQVKAVLTRAVTPGNKDEREAGNEDESAADDQAGESAISAEDLLNATIEARRAAPNLSYYAFTATPKPKTLELFGRLPNPAEPPAKQNKPAPFHVYSMRQAIEEGYILDVLRNYTNYKVAYKLAQRIDKGDREVDSKKAKVKLNQWVRLHDYNIAQKVMVIVEHFRATVMGLLNGQAKAMVVTGSRKEAVRYKLEFDKYIQKQGYAHLRALVAFSGEVTFGSSDPHSQALVGEGFTESSLNPGLKGRDLREAFDTNDYQIMIAANKFQTGFDQPKLCAMYVDKKLGGVDCVQTLSRLNRVYPGKQETYVLDFFNEPDEVLAAFQEYYQTAYLLNVSDPNLIWDLFDKLRAAQIFLWTEVTQFNEIFFTTSKSNAAISNICRPAVERWQQRYEQWHTEAAKQKQLFDHAKALNDPIFLANAEADLKMAQRELDALGLFKADLVAFTRYYEFMSQIVDYDSRDLEMLSLYARHLAPLLREKSPDDDAIDLTVVELSHYRLSKLKQQDLRLVKEGATGLYATTDLGTGKARDKQAAWLSQIIARLNEIFITDGLTDKDLINYAYTIADKVRENAHVMHQVANNAPDQVMIGDFPGAVDDAVIGANASHQTQMMQYLNNPATQANFQRLVLELVQAINAQAAQ
ncbi:MAG: type I restriction endonuclease subunit R [Caldilineaceae bacterium]